MRAASLAVVGVAAGAVVYFWIRGKKVHPAIKAGSSRHVKPSTSQTSDGIKRLVGEFAAPDGTVLARRSWEPVNVPVQRCMVIIHGLGEHCARYDAMGEWFAKRGCAVHSFDLRGHGLSDGHPNFVERFDDYADDAIALLALVRSEYPAVRHTCLVGHSMGGLVGARILSMRAPNVDCAVLSGAACSLPEDGGLAIKIKILIVRLLTSLAPKLTIPAGVSPEGLAADQEIGRAYVADPLVNTTITLSLGNGLLNAQADLLSGRCDASRIAVPLLGLHGADDSICAPSGTERLLAKVTTRLSEARLYPGLRHEIFNESSGKHAIWEEMLGFMRQVKAYRGCVD